LFVTLGKVHTRTRTTESLLHDNNYPENLLT
jgi:hypothetical protein